MGTVCLGIFNYDDALIKTLTHSFNQLLSGASTVIITTSIQWNLLYLAQHQEVQNQVRQELHDVLHGKTLHIDDLSKLPYTQATVAEVGRIRTLLPLGFPR
ncbi:hypothetical protein Zmor_022897 [Zophobas morio]|uniref:Cytochrome P450 n=1 Tax=Zophobas morio TaxID=2755281 RepID=A0AA38M715_9CUCU|nr:hypothetical protein Zmor_022897 [Zophobas morio]